MKCFIVPVLSDCGAGDCYPFELVLQAPTATDAHAIIDALIAHGHTISGILGGVATDNCDDIEGNDGKADAAIVYAIGTTDTDEKGDGELSIAGDATECDRAIMERAAELYRNA